MLKSLFLKNWKTLAAGIPALLAWILNSVGVTNLPPDVMDALTVLSLFAIGYLAKDGDKTGAAETLPKQ